MSKQQSSESLQKKSPVLLSYCCYARQAMPLSHYTPCSHAVKNTSRSKEETDNTPTDKTEQVTSGMKQEFCPLKKKNFRQKTQFCVPLMCWSSFHIYLKHKININNAFVQLRKDVNTHSFKFKSTEVNLLSCLICLSGKMTDSALLLVRSLVNQALCEW